MKQELSDTEAALVEDKKFLEDLEKNCATAQGDWDEICKVRAEELLALADTIKLLNSDDALELFKKALPGSASFVEMRATSQVAKSRALSIIRTARNSNHHPQLDLIALALSGKKSLLTELSK